MNKEYKIHAFYILGILIVAIIFLISIKWYDIPKLAELVTFGLTVTSLVLAILAIAYAVYSNSSFTQNITTLNDASQEIRTTAKNISEAAERLSRKIETIPTKLESMEGKFDQLMFERPTKAKDVLIADTAETKTVPEMVDFFAENSPIAIWISSYISFLSYEKRKAFHLYKPFSEGNLNGEFTMGFLDTMQSVNLLNYENNDGFCQITFLNEKLLNALNNHFDEILSDKFVETYITTAYQRRKIVLQKLNETLNAIDKYFHNNEFLNTVHLKEGIIEIHESEYTDK